MARIKIKIQDLFQKLQDNNLLDKIDDISFKSKINIKIKSPENKFIPILEFLKKNIDSYETIFSNNQKLISSNEHILLTTNGEKKIKDITYNDNIITKDNCDNISYIKKDKTIFKKENDTLYDFCLPYPHLYKSTNGLIHHNSLIMYVFTRYALDQNKKVLIVVPNKSLVTQLDFDFRDYGYKGDIHSITAGSEKESDKSIIISTYQSLIPILEEKNFDYFKQFTCFIQDEAHGASNSWKETKVMMQIANSCINADYRMGCTGTLQDAKIHKLQIISLYGPLYETIKTKKLMDEGYISKLKIYSILLNYPEEVSKKIARYEYDYQFQFQTSNENPRQKFITKLALSLENNTLILFQKIEHGKYLFELLNLNATKKTIYYIDGETANDEREHIKKQFKDNNNILLVASYGCYSTGINIKNLHNLILASSTKSKIRVLQSFGRTLRLNENKQTAFIYDLVDNFGYFQKHYQERLQLYINEKFDYQEINYDLKI